MAGKQFVLWVQNSVTWPRPRPLRGHFMVRMQQGSVIYVCAKFEADIFFRSKVTRGSQNFEIWSRDPGHAHLGVVLWSGRSRGPSSMSVPNLKRIALFFQKLLGGPKISNLGQVTLSHAHFGVILWSRRSRGPSSISVPNLKQISPFVQKL